MANVRNMGSIATLINKTITENGTYNANDDNADGYRQVNVSVASDIIYGTSEPSDSEGNNGDYYYLRTNSITAKGGNWQALSPSSQVQAGWEFYPNSEVILKSLYVQPRANISGYLLLGDTDGNRIVQTDSDSFTLNEWNEIVLDTTITLEANKHYIVQAVFNSSGGLNYANSSNITFSDLITYVQGRYGGFIGTTESGIAYSVDIGLKKSSEYYLITKQYVKENGVWVRLDS